MDISRGICFYYTFAAKIDILQYEQSYVYHDQARRDEKRSHRRHHRQDH